MKYFLLRSHSASLCKVGSTWSHHRCHCLLGIILHLFVVLWFLMHKKNIIVSSKSICWLPRVGPIHSNIFKVWILIVKKLYFLLVPFFVFCLKICQFTLVNLLLVLFSLQLLLNAFIVIVFIVFICFLLSWGCLALVCRGVQQCLQTLWNHPLGW